MVHVLAILLQKRGWSVSTEHPIYRRKKLIGFVDIKATLGHHTFAIEVENSTRQIASNLRKAGTLPATALWIVCPSPKLARQWRKKISNVNPHPCRIHIETLPSFTRKIASFPSNSGTEKDSPLAQQ